MRHALSIYVKLRCHEKTRDSGRWNRGADCGRRNHQRPAVAAELRHHHLSTWMAAGRQRRERPKPKRVGAGGRTRTPSMDGMLRKCVPHDEECLWRMHSAWFDARIAVSGCEERVHSAESDGDGRQL